MSNILNRSMIGWRCRFNVRVCKYINIKFCQFITLCLCVIYCANSTNIFPFKYRNFIIIPSLKCFLTKIYRRNIPICVISVCLPVREIKYPNKRIRLKLGLKLSKLFCISIKASINAYVAFSCGCIFIDFEPDLLRLSS